MKPQAGGGPRPSHEVYRGRGTFGSKKKIRTDRAVSGESVCFQWVNCPLEANSGHSLRKNTRVLSGVGFGGSWWLEEDPVHIGLCTSQRPRRGPCGSLVRRAGALCPSVDEELKAAKGKEGVS